jgi:prepilin-type N-terminal cleavage/methylation domain-containing protein
VRTQAPQRDARAFTLIELVISAALASMILTGAYLCLNAAISSQKLIEPRADVVQSARVAMSLMSADLRCACELPGKSPFLGMQRRMGDAEADNLDFATHNHTPVRAREGDFCEISYFMDKGEESGAFTLWRRRNPTIAPKPLEGGNREEIAQGLRGLKFEYYDGFDWYDTWGEVDGREKARSSYRVQPNLYGMPEAVRITLWFDPNPRPPKAAQAGGQDKPEAPLVFQTVARLNLASHLQRISSSVSTTSGDSGGAGQATPGPGSGGRN